MCIIMGSNLESVLHVNYCGDFRSAVSDTDEWPSKYSKLFIEVRIPTLFINISVLCSCLRNKSNKS